MNITIKHIGGYGDKPSAIIELTIECDGTTATEDVTNFDGSVDLSLIDSLKDIVSGLEEQNELLRNQNN